MNLQTKKGKKNESKTLIINIVILDDLIFISTNLSRQNSYWSKRRGKYVTSRLFVIEKPQSLIHPKCLRWHFHGI